MPEPTAGGNHGRSPDEFRDAGAAMRSLQQAMERFADELRRAATYRTEWTMTATPPAVGIGTEELRQRHDAFRRERMARVQAQHEELLRKERSAMDLLMACLTEQQRHDVKTHDYIEVISNRGNRWRIQTDVGYSGNVHLMKGSKGDVALAGFCAHANEVMATSEHFLIQKLVLEADEDQFVRVAVSQYRRPGADVVLAQMFKRFPGLRSRFF